MLNLTREHSRQFVLDFDGCGILKAFYSRIKKYTGTILSNSVIHKKSSEKQKKKKRRIKGLKIVL